MQKIKELLFFSYGDANDASTWSNVPYCFSKALEKKGIKVHRANLELTGIKRAIWNRTISKLLKIWWPKHDYSFIRSCIAQGIINRRIKKYVHKYPTADFCMFLMFGYYNKYSTIPSLLFGDWTYEMKIQERLGRKPYFFEKRTIRQETESLHKANILIPLFPKTAANFRLNGLKNVYEYTHNVVNILYDGIIDNNIIEEKKSSNRILFIGRHEYIEGAKLLIESFKILKRKFLRLELHIVGLNTDSFLNLPQNVYCYGFLHKDIQHENQIYYDLLKSAKVFVNPTPQWAGFSSMVEAMYFYTPIVVSKYPDFVSYFGEKLNCGSYSEENNSEYLSETISSILSSEQYNNLALASHDNVKEYSWDNYIDWLLQIMQQ